MSTQTPETSPKQDSSDPQYLAQFGIPNQMMGQNFQCFPAYAMYCPPPNQLPFGMHQGPLNWAFQCYDPLSYGQYFVKVEVSHISDFLKTQQENICSVQDCQNLQTSQKVQGLSPKAPFSGKDFEAGSSQDSSENTLKRTLSEDKPNTEEMPLKPLFKLTKELRISTQKAQVEGATPAQDELSQESGKLVKLDNFKSQLTDVNGSKSKRFENLEKSAFSPLDKTESQKKTLFKTPRLKQRQRDNEEIKELSQKYQDQDFEDKLRTQISHPSKKNYKGIRWGRVEDKKLFALIRTLEEEGKLSIQEILQMNPDRHVYLNPGVRILAKRFGWKSLFKHLVQRIQALYKKDFSVREIKILKQIIRKEYKYKNLDYTKIIYHFPGKKMERLVEICDQIISSKSQKSLSSFSIST